MRCFVEFRRWRSGQTDDDEPVATLEVNDVNGAPMPGDQAEVVVMDQLVLSGRVLTRRVRYLTEGAQGARCLITVAVNPSATTGVAHRKRPAAN